MLKNSKYSYIQIILLGAIAIAIALRIINLNSREFWYDEVLSLLLVTGQKSSYQNPPNSPVVLTNYQYLLSLPVEHNLSDVLHTGEKFLKGLVGEPHPPLFYIGQHLWLRLFGNSVAAMRSLSALYSVAAIACAYGLGRKLLGYRGGLLLAALLGLNPFYFFHSLNVRMYCSLVFWTILSGWAILELINPKPHKYRNIFWSVILIGSVAAGFMTFYYFAFWVATLGVLALLQDRKSWLKHAWHLSVGIAITSPWLLWGTRQQLNNADLGRFAASGSLITTTLKHLQGVIQTLGIQIIIGDWASIASPLILTITGLIAIAILIFCSLSLWRANQRQILQTVLVLGIAPLLMMLAVDIVSGKFTLDFGMGRSAIFILPGCLLILAAWVTHATGKWQTIIVSILLTTYLTINVADLSSRSRWMFHQIADIIEQESVQPTLIIMNSNAWGHVMRLAYYLPPESSVMLLAQKPAKLIPALAKTLTAETQYQRLLWLDSDRPVWGSPTTATQTEQIQKTLDKQFQLVKQQRLTGTWKLDHFTVNLYQHR
jgi:uncharacterized membrane protein